MFGNRKNFSVLFQERHCHWQLPIRSCCGSMLRVVCQLEAFTLSTKVTLPLFVFFCFLLFFFTHNLLHSEQVSTCRPLHILISVIFLLILWNCRHHSSCASNQWQSVQFGARASLWQADRFRVLGRLCGPLWVQSRLSSERIQCYSVSGHARCPRSVECNNTNLYR